MDKAGDGRVRLRGLTGLVLILLLLVLPERAVLATGAPDVHARAALMIDAQTGQVLYSLNAQARMYPASTTKVLTALVAVEHGHLTDQYTVSTNAVNLPPDSTLAGLRAGEKLTLEQLLYGLLLPSGNDAAVAIAEGIAGSESAFAKLMNQKAAELGATHSHFVNASGLHDPQHYTTAADLAVIANAAFHNPILARIAGTEEYTLPGNRTITNHDGLLGYYDGVVAGKTGFTEQAGRTLVTLARREQRELIGVVMNTQLLYTDMMALLDYGFGNFSPVAIVKTGQSAGIIPVANGNAPSVTAVASKDFTYDVPKGTNELPTIRANLFQNLRAPVEAGQKIGELAVMQGSAELARIDLVANSDVAYQAPVVALARRAVKGTHWWTWAAGAGFLVGAAGLRVAYVARRRRYRRMRYRTLTQAAVTRRRL